MVIALGCYCSKFFDLHLKIGAKNTDFIESVLQSQNQIINELGYANTNDFLLAYEKLLDKLGLDSFNHLHKKFKI